MLYTATRNTMQLLLRVACRPEIEGVENVPPEGPVLLASNHMSFIDSIVIPSSVPRRVTFLAKSEYFEGTGLRGTVVKMWFESLGAVPVHRDGSGDSAQAALMAGMAALERGWALGVYPEGTRTRDGRLYRGRSGVAWLALNAPAPVVPVGLIGTDKVQPVDARIPRPGRIRVRFGEPLRPEAYAGYRSPSRARAALTEDLMDRIAALSGQPRADTFNQRPSDV